MVSIFFGVPGCGKTTLLVMRALKAIHAGKKVYCNVNLKLTGVTYIENNWIGKYDMSNSKILIDEATIFADSRNFAKFPPEVVEFFVLHRHYKCDIELYAQIYNRVDSTIRMLCERVYWVRKSILPFVSYYVRVPYGIAFTPPPEGTGSKYGDINEGYAKPSLISMIFAKRYFRPLYYKYFDSYEHKHLPPIPV